LPSQKLVEENGGTLPATLTMARAVVYVRARPRGLSEARAWVDRVRTLTEKNGRAPRDDRTATIALLLQAQVLKNEGRAEEALPLIAEVLAVHDRHSAADNPRKLITLLTLGEIHLARSRSSDAVPVLDRAVAVRLKFSRGPISLAAARFQLARALWDSGGDRGRARQLIAEARPVLLGSHHSRVKAELQAWLNAHP
jgi:eukaryotic-like serine/threonine-protein kinase